MHSDVYARAWMLLGNKRHEKMRLTLRVVATGRVIELPASAWYLPMWKILFVFNTKELGAR